MRRSKSLLLLLAVSLLAVTGVLAGETSTLTKNRRGTSASILPGYWHRNFTEAKKYADNHGIPFIAVWSNGDGCPHCVKFENCCNTTYFKNWQKTSGIVFWFGHSGDSEYPIACDEFHWARGNVKTAYPFVRIWWKKGGVDHVTVGDDLDDYTNGTAGAKKVVSRIKAKLKKFVPTPPVSYYGGEFAFNNLPGDRLEAEVGMTTSVRIDLRRTNATAAAQVATNYVVVTTGSRAVTNTVAWAANAKTNSFDLAVTPVAGTVTKLELFDADMTLKATNAVTYVAKQTNKPSNPYFSAKEHPELDFGEWTMDLDQVTNLVRKANATRTPVSKAYALVLFGGSMWCKDCARTEKYFFETKGFTDWAKKKSVALGVVDIPNFPNESVSPCLLTRVSAETGDDYRKATGLTQTSGLGYLSRHMITDEAAAEQLEKNRKLASQNTLNGGWNRPERANQSRPGVPILVLLREDGSIAGRFTAFATESPSAYNANYLTRLDELLAQADLPEEEDNDAYQTTTEKIGKRVTLERTLSFNDMADVYRFTDETKSMRLKLDLKGTVETPLTLGVWNLTSKGAFTAVTNVTGSLKDGVSLVCTIPSTNTFLQVTVPDAAKSISAANVSPYFSVAKAGSTVCPYTLSSDFILQPEEERHTALVEDGNRAMTMSLVEGTGYKLTGLDETACAELFDLTNGLHVAKSSGDKTLKLAADQLDYQIWKPGRIGFSLAAVTVSESAGEYEIAVRRSGGASGEAHATISLDTAASSGLSDLVVWEDEGKTLDWDEGETDVQSFRVTIVDNPNADGDQRFVFRLSCSGDAEEGTTTFTLLIKDNDRAVPGKIAFVEADPQFAKTMTVLAKENTTVRLGVGRRGGSDGSASVTLKASAGSLDTTSCDWEGRNADKHDVNLALPSAAQASKVTVSLTAASKATKLDVDAKKVTVVVMDASVPEFESASEAIEAVRYVPIIEKRIKVVDSFVTASTKVVKYSGSLASGLTWRYADGEVIVSGVPVKRETSTIVLQVKNGSKAGLTCAVTVRVVDPATDREAADGSAMTPNPILEKTYTFADVQVYEPATNRLAGLLTVTLPRTGKASAKYRTTVGTMSLAAKSWSTYDPESGALTVLLKGTTAATAGMELLVSVDGDGTVSATLTDTAAEGQVLSIPSMGSLWNRERPATDYKGYYTVTLPGVGKSATGVDTKVVSGEPVALGDGYVTLKMTAASAIQTGKFAYAGVLPNGKAFSGSAVLTADWDEELGAYYYGLLPLLQASSSDPLSGVVAIRPGAMNPEAQDYDSNTQTCGSACYYQLVRRSVYPFAEAPLLWEHLEKSEEASFAVALDIHGGIYNASDDFTECCTSALGTTKLTFFAETLRLAGTEFGDGKAWVTNTTGVTVSHTAKTGNALALAAKTNSYGLTLSYSASTGLVSGRFKLPMTGGSVWVDYVGVMMPGWGSNTCNECGLGGVEATRRPFVSGTAWFEDDATFDYTTGKGKVKPISVRRSIPISIGVEAGK